MGISVGTEGTVTGSVGAIVGNGMGITVGIIAGASGASDDEERLFASEGSGVGLGTVADSLGRGLTVRDGVGVGAET